MMKKPVIIPFQDSYNDIVIVDTRGSMEASLSSRLREHIDFGSGETPKEAAESLIRSIRQAADQMEVALKTWCETHCGKCGSKNAPRITVKDFGSVTADFLRCKDCGEWTNLI